MNDDLLKQTLEEMAQEVPDDMNLFPKIETQLKRQVRRGWFSTRMRPGWVALLLAVLLTLSAAAYAIGLLVESSDPGLAGARQANLIQPLNLDQKVDDHITVTLNYAYADANRIAIGYTIHGETHPDETVTYSDVVLRDDAGHQFTGLFGGGGGGGGGGSSEPPAWVPFATSGEMSYDASVITGTPQTVNLTLAVTVQKLGQRPASESTPAPDETVTPSTGMSGGGGGGGGGKGTPLEAYVIQTYDPVVFTFSVPFNPGITLSTPQTVTANGITMTLKNAVVTPSLARLELCFDAPAPPLNTDWTPAVTLQIGKDTVVENRLASSFVPLTQEACGAYTLNESFYDRTGAWTLTVLELRIRGSQDESKVVDALAKQGISATALPGGGLNFDTPPNMSNEDIGALIERTEGEFQQKIVGPWLFHLDLH